MERAEVTRLEQLIDREVKARFAPGAVRRVAVLQEGDDPAIGPDELLVRVFAGAPILPGTVSLPWMSGPGPPGRDHAVAA